MHALHAGHPTGRNSPRRAVGRIRKARVRHTFPTQGTWIDVSSKLPARALRAFVYPIPLFRSARRGHRDSDRIKLCPDVSPAGPVEALHHDLASAIDLHIVVVPFLTVMNHPQHDQWGTCAPRLRQCAILDESSALPTSGKPLDNRGVSSTIA